MSFFVGKATDTGKPLLSITSDTQDLNTISKQTIIPENSVFHSDLPYVFATSGISLPLSLRTIPRTIPYYSTKNNSYTRNVTHHFLGATLTPELKNLLNTKPYIMYFTMSTGHRVMAPITFNQYTFTYDLPYWKAGPNSVSASTGGGSGLTYQFYNKESAAVFHAGIDGDSGGGYYDGATDIAVTTHDPFRGGSTTLFDKTRYISRLPNLNWEIPIAPRNSEYLYNGIYHPVSVTFQFLNLNYNPSTETHSRELFNTSGEIYAGNKELNIGGLPLEDIKFLNYTETLDSSQNFTTPLSPIACFMGANLQFLNDNQYYVDKTVLVPIKFNFWGRFSAFYGVRQPDLTAINDSLSSYKVPSRTVEFDEASFDEEESFEDSESPLANTSYNSAGVFSFFDPQKYISQGFGWSIDSNGIYVTNNTNTYPIFYPGVRKYTNKEIQEKVLNISNSLVSANFSQIGYEWSRNVAPTRGFEQYHEYIGSFGSFNEDNITGMLGIVSNILDNDGIPKKRCRNYTLVSLPKGSSMLVYQGTQETMGDPRAQSGHSIFSVTGITIYLSRNQAGVVSLYRTTRGVQHASTMFTSVTEVHQGSTDLDTLIRQKSCWTCRIQDTTSLSQKIVFIPFV